MTNNKSIQQTLKSLALLCNKAIPISQQDGVQLYTHIQKLEADLSLMAHQANSADDEMKILKADNERMSKALREINRKCEAVLKMNGAEVVEIEELAFTALDENTIEEGNDEVG